MVSRSSWQITSNRLQTIEWKALDVCMSSTANSIASRSMPRLIAFCIAETQASRECRYGYRGSLACSISRDGADNDGLARNALCDDRAGLRDRIGVDGENRLRILAGDRLIDG
jgi:hypothetical protein